MVVLAGAVLVAFAPHHTAVASALSANRRLQGCEDIAGWTDTDGHTCAFYATNYWCCSEEAGPHCDAALFNASLGQLDQTDGCCGSCSAECVDDDAAATATTGYDCTFIGANGACPQLEAAGVASMCGCACAQSPPSGCEDTAGWTDPDGHTCAVYATNGWCCSEEAGPHCAHNAQFFNASLGEVDDTDGCCGSCSAECVNDDNTTIQVYGQDCNAIASIVGGCQQVVDYMDAQYGRGNPCGCACGCVDSPGYVDSDGHTCPYLKTNNMCNRSNTEVCCGSCNADCVDDDDTAGRLTGITSAVDQSICQILTAQDGCQTLSDQGQEHVCGCSCGIDHTADDPQIQFANYSTEFDPSVGCYDGTQCCDLPWWRDADGYTCESYIREGWCCQMLGNPGCATEHAFRGVSQWDGCCGSCTEELNGQRVVKQNTCLDQNIEFVQVLHSMGISLPLPEHPRACAYVTNGTTRTYEHPFEATRAFTCDDLDQLMSVYGTNVFHLCACSCTQSNATVSEDAAGSCSDHVKGPHEDHVDCGGPDCPPCVAGCTVPIATNYDVAANVDDGSCDFDGITQCTDQKSTTFEPAAHTDYPQSCQYDCDVLVALLLPDRDTSQNVSCFVTHTVPQPSCRDISGWTDSNGHTCASYATNSWCCSDEAGPHCNAQFFNASLGEVDDTDGCCASCSADCVDDDAAADAVTGGQGYDCAFIGANGTCLQLEAAGVASMCGCACAPSPAPEPEPEPELSGLDGFRASLGAVQGIPALNGTQTVLQYSRAATEEPPQWSANPLMKTLWVKRSHLGLYGDPGLPDFPPVRVAFMDSVSSIWFLTWRGIHTHVADPGETGQGGALHLQQNSQVNVHSCKFYGMHAQDFGGAIYVASSDIRIENTVFAYNQAQIGGAMYMTRNKNKAGEFAAVPRVVIVGSQFSNNQAEVGSNQQSGSGGALLGEEADLRVYRTNFSTGIAESGQSGNHRSVTNVMIGGSVLYGDNMHKLIFQTTDIEGFSNSDSILLANSRPDYCGDTPCPLGFSCTYQNFSLWCVPCPPPLVSIDGVTCARCVSSTGPSFDRSECIPCEAGTASDTGDCHACPRGDQPNPQQSDCEPCPDMHVSPNGTACVLCPNGTQPDPQKISCSPCNPVSEIFDMETRACVCGPGATRMQDHCQPCAAGQFKPSSGEHSCTACGVSAIENQNHTGCVCPVSSYNVTYGMITCFDKAEQITLDQIEAEVNIADLSVCQPCGGLPCIQCGPMVSSDRSSHVTVSPGYGLPRSLMEDGYRGLQTGNLNRPVRLQRHLPPSLRFHPVNRCLPFSK